MTKEYTQIELILLRDNLAIKNCFDNGFIHTAKAYLKIFEKDLECYKEILGEKGYIFYNEMYRLAKEDLNKGIEGLE